MIANLKSAERGKSPAGGVPTMLKQAEIDEKLIHKLKNTKSTSGSSALIAGLMQQNSGMPAEQFQSSGLEMIGFNPYTSYPGYDRSLLYFWSSCWAPTLSSVIRKCWPWNVGVKVAPRVGCL